MKDNRTRLFLVIIGIIIIVLFTQYTSFPFWINILFGAAVGYIEYLIANYINKNK